MQVYRNDSSESRPRLVHPADFRLVFRINGQSPVTMWEPVPPEGYVALVHPRSGLAARHGLSIVNTPGTIDAGYRGEVKVMLINHDPVESIELRRGDRIAQLVVQRFERAAFVEVAALPESVRGSGGYGSTGGFQSNVSESE